MKRIQDQFKPNKTLLPKIKDSITLGVISGILGTMAIDLINFFNWKTKKTEFLYGHLGASVLMSGLRAKKKNNFIFGELIHLITGSLAALPLVYLFKKTGKDHALLKGTTYGSIVYLVYYVLGIKSHIFNSQPKLNKTHKTSLWQNLLYGVFTAGFITSLAHPSVFSNRTAFSFSNDRAYNANLISQQTSNHSDYNTDRPLH